MKLKPFSIFFLGGGGECEFKQCLLNYFSTYCFRNILTYVVFVEKEFILGSHLNLVQMKYIIALQIKYYI